MRIMERENLHSSDDSSSYTTVPFLCHSCTGQFLVPVRVSLFSTVLYSVLTSLQEDLELSSFFKFLDRTTVELKIPSSCVWGTNFQHLRKSNAIIYIAVNEELRIE